MAGADSLPKEEAAHMANRRCRTLRASLDLTAKTCTSRSRHTDAGGTHPSRLRMADHRLSRVSKFHRGREGGFPSQIPRQNLC